MKFQALLVLSLAYAVSAQYSNDYNNYYVRPLQATSYGQQAPTMEVPAPAPVTQAPVVESYESYRQEAPKMRPMTVEPVRTLTREENPCSEEVLRAPEIQAFQDPLDRRSYIVCTEIDVFVRMPCATGTFFDAGIRHCVPDGWVAPVCPVGLCKNNADCIIDELKNEYKCLCRVGFTGIFCETNIDECALEGNAYCRSQNGQCVDQINAYYCDFGDKIGLSLDTAIPKPCTLIDLSLEKQFFKIEAPMDNVYLQCLGENRWLVSKCAEMLFWNQELRTCTIEQPIKKTGVCNTYPCKNDGICEDTGNFQFTCSCRPGFTGALCEEVIDFCLPQPCGSGRCVSHPGGFNCVCRDNVVDQSCERDIQNPCTKPLDYFPHPFDFSRYISCGLDRFAFIKSCAPGTFWDNNLKTCVAEEVMPSVPKAAPKSIFDGQARSYNEYRPMSPAPLPVTTPAYRQYEAVTQPPRQTPPPVTTQAYKQYEAVTLPRQTPPPFVPATTPAYQQYETVTLPRQTPPPFVPATTPAYQQYETVTLPRQTPPPFVPPTTPRTPYSQMTRPQMPQTFMPRPQMPVPQARGY